jgi:hypothetical protein
LKSHGVILEPRRSHAADFLGRNLIIVGGIGKRGKFLNDIAVFNTSKNTLYMGFRNFQMQLYEYRRKC